MLLTSLVGFSYAAPNPQPLQSNNNTNPCTWNSPNYNPDCHQDKGNGDPHNGNGGGSPCSGAANPKAELCGCGESTPHATEAGPSINTNNPEVSDQPYVIVC